MVWFDFQDLLVQVASSVLQVPGTWHRQVMRSKYEWKKPLFWLTSPSGCKPKLLGDPKFCWFCGCNHQNLEDFTGFFDLRPVPEDLPWEAEELHRLLFSPKFFPQKNLVEKCWILNCKEKVRKKKSMQKWDQESKLWTPSDFARMEENLQHQTRLYVMLKTWLCATVCKHSFWAKGNENSSAKSAGFSIIQFAAEKRC